MALAQTLADAEADLAAAELSVELAKERVRMLREESVPSAMQELDLKEIKLTDGRKLTVRQDVYCQLSADNKREAYAWLDNHGFGGLIRIGVKADYGKGEAEMAKALFHELAGRGIGVSMIEDVHAQTMKAFLREQIAAGTAIPLDLFGARPVWTAKISKK